MPYSLTLEEAIRRRGMAVDTLTDLTNWDGMQRAYGEMCSFISQLQETGFNAEDTPYFSVYGGLATVGIILKRDDYTIDLSVKPNRESDNIDGAITARIPVPIKGRIFKSPDREKVRRLDFQLNTNGNYASKNYEWSLDGINRLKEDVGKLFS